MYHNEPGSDELAMLESPKTFIVVLSVLLFSALGCGLSHPTQTSTEGKAPIRQIRILIDVDRQDELISKLEGFAKEQDFTIMVRSVEGIPNGLFIELYRDDLMISALTVPDAPTKIDLALYERNLLQTTPDETVNVLFNNLLDRIHEIPNVTINDVK